MSVDLSISRWVRAVPSRQWAREDGALEALGAALPGLILASPPLAQVHRLDLALFAVFEEAALRVSGALTRLAPSLDGMNFAYSRPSTRRAITRCFAFASSSRAPRSACAPTMREKRFSSPR